MAKRYKAPGEERKQEISKVGDAIRELLKVYRLEARFNATELTSHWAEIVGPAIANRTSRIFVKNDVLFVEVTSPPLKQELNLNKSKLLRLIEEKMGKSVVKEIIIM